MNIEKRKKVYLMMVLFFLTLLGTRASALKTESGELLWWSALLIFGAMITGFLYQPLNKSLFPVTSKNLIRKNGDFPLKDYETLFGYYGLVALFVMIGGLILGPPLYGRQIVFEVKFAEFWFATLASGILNVPLFYLFTKALRYGDISLVSVTQTLLPVFTIPISFGAFLLFPTIIGDQRVSMVGLIGISITLAAISINTLTQKKKVIAFAPKNDFFANHPTLSGVVATIFSGFAVIFDKIAIDAANPFLHGITVPLTVMAITGAVILIRSGKERIFNILKRYKKEFLIMGAVYALIILVMNIAVHGHNINYYAAIKRTSAIFGTFYGIYILGEGERFSQKLIRIAVAVSVIIGIFLIAIKG